MTDNSDKIKCFILAGEPGIGKTTLTKKLIIELKALGVKTAGFHTEEVIKNKMTEGFDVVTLDGMRGRLARDQSLVTGPVKHKVAHLAIFTKEFETVVVPALCKVQDSPSCLIMDELGKIELSSERFKNLVKVIFSPAADCIALATVPVKKDAPIIECVKEVKRAKVWMVTVDNRSTIHTEVLLEIKKSLGVS